MTMPKQARRSKKAAGNTARLLISIAVIAGCLIAAVIALIKTNPSSKNVVAYVNGLAIDVREFHLVAEEERTGVLTDLTDRWGVEADQGFWKLERDGITPASELERRTLDTLVRMKIEQQLMVEAGLLEDEGYGAFYDDWTQTNRQRKQAAERGEVIYGPVTYTKTQYYYLRQDKKVIELQEKLAVGSLAPSREEQMKYYTTAQEPFLFKDGKRKPFEEVANVVVKRLVEEKYQHMVDQKIKTADITLKRKTLDKIEYN